MSPVLPSFQATVLVELHALGLSSHSEHDHTAPQRSWIALPASSGTTLRAQDDTSPPMENTVTRAGVE